jgi:3-hydroxyisobutyrate dehydrogenase-like beta-hydroxyacid dehydrogenase
VSRAVRIALLGYGEVGQTLAADLHARGIPDLKAWDILFPRADSAPSRALALKHVTAGKDLAEALAGAELVISAVTAAQCVVAARSARVHLARDAWYVDLNSVAPGTKAQAAELVATGGGRYVEAAVMSPIGPKRSASPMLLGGPHVDAFLPVGRALGFDGMRAYSSVVGRASAAKMCRSVMVKGIEALLTESLLAARHYGVEDDVLASLEDLFPVGDWRKLARYMISRSLLHGTRRAEEMREVAKTVADAGLDPWLSAACGQRQAWTAQHAEALEHDSLTDLLDAIHARLAGPAGVTTP